MPYSNEHACRLKSPDLYDEFRRGKRKHDGKEYSVIYGKKKSGGKWEAQSYRYPTDEWTSDTAKSHCTDHKGILFEPATGETGDASTTTGRKTMKTQKGLHGHIPLMMPPLKGSWEYISCELESTAADHLEAHKADFKEWDDILLLATFPDRAVVCSCGWNPVPKSCWSIAWEMKDGEPTWTGAPQDVEITTDIQAAAASIATAKRNASALEKNVVITEQQWQAFKKDRQLPTMIHLVGVSSLPVAIKGQLALKHRNKLSDAKDFVKQVADSSGLEKSSKVLLDKSTTLLDEVLTDTTPEEEGTDGQTPKTIAGMGRKLLASLVLADQPAVDEAKRFADDLKGVLHVIDRQHEEDAVNKMFAEMGG